MSESDEFHCLFQMLTCPAPPQGIFLPAAPILGTVARAVTGHYTRLGSDVSDFIDLSSSISLTIAGVKIFRWRWIMPIGRRIF